MEYFFDLHFLKSLESIGEIEEYIYDDFKYFINKLDGEKCYLVCEVFPTREEFQSSLFLRLLGRVLSNNSIISNNALESIFINQESTCFKFCFLNNSFIKSNDIRVDFGYYAANSSELNKIWEKFHSRRSSEDLKRSINNIKDKLSFNKWGDFEEFVLPINSIVVSDNYLFENQNSFEYNLKELLFNIGLKKLKKRNIDILIITNSECIYDNNTSITDKSLEDKFKIAFEHLKNVINSILDPNCYNLTFIRLDKNTNPSKFESHARFCLTNTTFINPHHSFTLFGPNNKVHKNEYIDFSSLLWQGPRGLVKLNAIKFIKKAFNNINNEKLYNKNKSKFEMETRVLIHNNKSCTMLK